MSVFLVYVDYDCILTGALSSYALYTVLFLLTSCKWNWNLYCSSYLHALFFISCETKWKALLIV